MARDQNQSIDLFINEFYTGSTEKGGEFTLLTSLSSTEKRESMHEFQFQLAACEGYFGSCRLLLATKASKVAYLRIYSQIYFKMPSRIKNHNRRSSRQPTLYILQIEYKGIVDTWIVDDVRKCAK